MEFNSQAVTDYLQEQLSPFDLSKYSSLVLGCTHFNYFKDTLRKILPENVQFVDGNEGTVRELIRRLKERNQLEHNAQSVTYFYSGRQVTDPLELERLQKCLARLEKMYGI
jgi:glutamate racemase